eukprot:CAMPEP_0197442188 /NCGR_PEP_ID=MMETSP1175-20131217/8260_1 /TAXON_ID=1003142 /ORGANISM="Triceratium dubium, Strain CCMP147" /LENGTH=263 /DNA_ID=CAMNT_0042972611 /DNA_START=648 /DNA_END=1441 /DNA_ORIENTATION=-
MTALYSIDTQLSPSLFYRHRPLSSSIPSMPFGGTTTPPPLPPDTGSLVPIALVQSAAAFPSELAHHRRSRHSRVGGRCVACLECLVDGQSRLAASRTGYVRSTRQATFQLKKLRLVGERLVPKDKTLTSLLNAPLLFFMVDTFPPLRVEDVTFVTFEQLYAPSSFASSMNQVTGNILDSKEDVSGTVRNRKRNVTPSEERGRPMATAVTARSQDVMQSRDKAVDLVRTRELGPKMIATADDPRSVILPAVTVAFPDTTIWDVE